MTTQFARASYQEIIDLHTEEDTVSVIGIHTPQGDTPRQMFGGFFDQFKKFKYLGCSVSLVPAARLPTDPLHVSYEAGEQYIDPRDMLNPLMFHGCHGNDMGVILNRFYNTNSIADQPQTDSTFYYADSITDITDGDHISGLQLEDLYYKALTDNTWKKAHPQRGFKKSGLRPLVYSMATNMQFSGGDSIGMSGFGIPEDLVDDVSISGTSITATFPVSQNGRRFFTPRLTGLGWLDTRNVLTTATTVTGSTADIRAMLGDAALAQQNASEADLPLVYMGMILLPPAYKTEQYFRMIVNHHFAFKDFRGISFSNNLVEPPAYNQLNDSDARYYPDGGSVDPPTPDPPIGGGDDIFLSGVNLSISGLPGFGSSAGNVFALATYHDVDYQLTYSRANTNIQVVDGIPQIGFVQRLDSNKVGLWFKRDPADGFTQEVFAFDGVTYTYQDGVWYPNNVDGTHVESAQVNATHFELIPASSELLDITTDNTRITVNGYLGGTHEFDEVYTMSE